jgi:hypothetical protein
VIISKTPLVPSLGLYPAGDLGELTLYTDRDRQVVCYPRAPPTRPPTFMQQRQRRIWSAAAESWRTEPAEIKTNWDKLCRRNGIPLSGHQLYMRLKTTIQRESLTVLAARAGIALADL